jgi:hypothetical protein
MHKITGLNAGYFFATMTPIVIPLYVQRQIVIGDMISMTAFDPERLNRLLSHKQFEPKVKSSTIWLYDALRLYRASQILFQTAKNAQDLNMQNTMQEFAKRNKTEISTSRPGTLEEYILMIDSSLIRLSYFYLSRSIELLLKAILIERKEDYFLEIGSDGKMSFQVRFGHQLIEYADECAIELPEKERIQVRLLQDLLYWGTFPIPLSEEMLFVAFNQQNEALDLEKKMDFRLTIENYYDTSMLFDKFLGILNDARHNHGRTTFSNVFR